ncbi:ABC transporter permease [Breoghania sp. JC706]|uniref:ABC transporter permease n=1 Tax=Breoghania sp. JC706 TaxID=3117732 RepID=UPI0030095A27
MTTVNAEPGIVLRLAPVLTVAVLILPVSAGVAGVALPAFGYLPALGGTRFTLAPWHALMAMPGIWHSAALSFAAALVTALCSFLLVQFFVAAWHGTRLFSMMQRALSPLLSMPHAAAAFSLAFLFAPSGWIMRLLSPWATGLTRPPDLLVIHDQAGLAMMAGLIAKETPFLFLMTLAALPQTPALRLGQFATSFGYGRIAGFFKVTLPLLYPQIRLPILAVIAYASSVVDVAIILGPTRPAPLAVQLTRWMNDPDLALRFTASAGALLQLAVTASAIACWIGAERIAIAISRRWRTDGRRLAKDGLVRFSIALATIALVGALTLGLVVLALWSVSGFWPFPDAFPPTVSLQTWMRALPQARDAILTTIWVGLAALSVALVLTIACLERETRTGRQPAKAALNLVYVPLLVPQVAFLFGLQFLLLAAGLGTNAGALALVHFVLVLPYVFLSLGDPWRAWDPRYGHVAAGFGARPSRVFWRIRLPMLVAPILTAAAVGFAVSASLYLPTLLIGGGRYSTITTEAVALASGGNRRLIAVYALMQMLLPLVGFAVAIAVPALLFRNRRTMRSAA